VTAWLRHVPNLISAARIALVAPVVWTLLHDQLAVTLLLFGAAAASDGADGFLAKHFAWQSELGAILDPAADKLLLATVFLTLAVIGAAPPWLTAAAVGRDVVLVLGALAYRQRFGKVKVRPSAISKTNTLCQLAFVLTVIARLRFGWPPAWLVTGLGALTFVTVCVSGIDYVLIYGGRALVEMRMQRRPAA
jgi:cardiolipin synthase